MLRKILDLVSTNKIKLSKGLGTPNLPKEVYKGEQPVTSNDFKLIVNQYFLPKIYEIGFHGKDFLFYRENKDYTEIIFFWTYKTGGAIQVDLAVKFNNIIYPDQEVQIKTKHLRPENCEFHKRLSPEGENVWFWIFKNNSTDNIEVVNDIWRLFSLNGVEYFNKFKNHRLYIQQLDSQNILDFPDFQLTKFNGKYDKGIIYFLFDYWRQLNDKDRASKFAKIGLDKVEEVFYLKIFSNYLSQNGKTLK
jgi:hypothetical protein